jgi:hypothetical protein
MSTRYSYLFNISKLATLKCKMPYTSSTGIKPIFDSWTLIEKKRLPVQWDWDKDNIGGLRDVLNKKYKSLSMHNCTIYETLECNNCKTKIQSVYGYQKCKCGGISTDIDGEQTIERLLVYTKFSNIGDTTFEPKL